MTDFAALIWSTLWRTTFALTLAALVCDLVLRLARPRSPMLHRAAWLWTLLIGWSFLQISVPVAWYEASLSAPTQATDETVLTDSATPVLSAKPLVDKAAPTRITVTWSLVAIAIWGLGIAGLIGTWSIGYLRFIRHLPTQQPTEPEWENQWQVLLASAKVKTAIPLRVTPDTGPLLCRRRNGYELIVPAKLWHGLKPDEREAILRHELAHYQRDDVWKSLAARLLMLPHWFNPAAWWAVRRFDEAAEWACDQAVLEFASAPTYAQTLLRLGQTAATSSPGLAARGGSLAVRIRRLLLPPAGQESSVKRAVVIGFICLSASSALLRVDLVAKEPADQGQAGKKSERPAPAMGEQLRQRRLQVSPFVVGSDDGPGALSPVPLVPNRDPADAFAAPFRSPENSPTAPDAEARVVPIPNYFADPAAGGKWTFKGPRGETFETDGLHLWRIDGRDREGVPPRRLRAAPRSNHGTPPGYPATQPSSSPTAPPATGLPDKPPKVFPLGN